MSETARLVPRSLGAAPAPEARPRHTSFSDLVHAHFAWCHGAGNGRAAHAEDAYHELLHRFEDQHGRLVDTYWCSHLESGIALTEQPRRLGRPGTLALHRETDWATKRFPDVAAQLHRCDELAIRARTVLTGVRQRICLQLVAASATHLLSLVDGPASPETAADLRAALKTERQALDRAERYYREAANGQAEIVYFAGMAAVALAVTLGAGVFLRVEWRIGVAALVAGAIGAVVSVVQRINSRTFHVDYDVGRPYAFFLGGLRPLIGGALAIVIAFAFSSGMLHLPISSTDPTDVHLALGVISFVAGFSERWAQDTLASVVPQAQTPPEQAAPEHT
jgi:hypothetical protein